MSRGTIRSKPFLFVTLLALAAPASASWVSPEIGEAHGLTSPVIVDPATGAWAEQVQARAASSGAGSLVVWSERDAAGLGDIRGTRLDAAGNVLDPDGFPIFVGPGDQRVPDVVWNGESYLVVWETRLLDYGDVQAIHVGADGVVLDPAAITVVSGPGQHGYPSVASGGERYLVAWHGPDQTSRATAVTRAGEVLTPGGFVLVNAPFGQAYPDLAYAAASDTFLVVWGDHRRTPPDPLVAGSHEWPPWDVYGMRLRIDAAGSPVFLDSLTDSLPIHVGQQCDRRPRVATDGAGFLVVDSCVDGPGTWNGTDVRMTAIAHLVDADGTVHGSVPVSGGVGDAWSVNVAFVGPGYQVVWVDGATTPPELRARRLSAAGALLAAGATLVAGDPRFLLEPPPPDGRLLFTSHVTVDRTRPGEALVTYARETPDGTPRTRARLVGDPAFALSISKIGAGTGRVRSTPAAIDCGPTCTANLPAGGTYALAAVPDAGFTFTGWSGACSGTGPCAVTMGAARSVGASFQPMTYRITVVPVGTGGGRIRGSYGPDDDLDCLVSGSTCTCSVGSGCAMTVPFGWVARLVAEPDGSSLFKGWTTSCTGTGTCSVTMNSAKTVGIRFDPSSYAFSANLAGAGRGTVTAANLTALPPAELFACTAGTCTATVPSGAQVGISALPDAGFLFTGWTGTWCRGTANTCLLAMDATKAVTASFQPAEVPLTVTPTGTGAGTVTGGPIACTTGSSAGCTGLVPWGGSVTLSAAPSPGSVFKRWEGVAGCSTSPSCTVSSIRAARFVDARFEPATFRVTVSMQGLGTGTVSRTGPAFTCEKASSSGATCSFVADNGTTVSLAAAPAGSSTFRGWGVTCTGTGACSFVANSDKSVGAAFDPAP